ncbi:MAG: hypothetical protein ACREOQ_19415 [Gemmatimonadales bacterium]
MAPDSFAAQYAARKSAPAPSKPAIRGELKLGLILLGLLLLGAVLRSGGGTSSNASSSATKATVILPSVGAALWRSKPAFDEALGLIAAGVHKTDPVRLLPLRACSAEQGDTVAVLNYDGGAQEVEVVAGPRKGCRGWLSFDMVGER